MEPQDFLRLIKNSKCLIGNSSVGIREGSFLGIPVVNIGTRQNRRERAKSIIDCGYTKEEIKNAIEKHLLNGHYESEFIYGDGYAGKKIADALATCELKFHKTITY
jgi:UDP-N-acetylglucosamine 2-epimerase